MGLFRPWPPPTRPDLVDNLGHTVRAVDDYFAR